MKKSKLNNSPKKNKDDDLIGLTDKQKAEKVLKLAHEQQRAKEQDSNLTAVIVRGDKKANFLKWIKADKLNEEIGL